MVEIKKEEGGFPHSPFAKHKGELQLGDTVVDCYVLDTGDRVISLGATVKAITNINTSNLGEYIGVKSLKPYINSELVAGETIAFNIPGNPTQAKGITAERFLDICHAYK